MELEDAVRIVRELVDGPEPLRSPWDEALEAVLTALHQAQGDLVNSRAEVSRSHKAVLALTGEVERLRADLEIAEPQKSAAVNALAARADKAEAERDEAEAEVERLRAALREIEQVTEGIPEANCMFANRIARVALAP
jgi:chromosome segregation ATPase